MEHCLICEGLRGQPAVDCVEIFWSRPEVRRALAREEAVALIRLARKLVPHLRQGRLASLLGISQSAVSRIEAGRLGVKNPAQVLAVLRPPDQTHEESRQLLSHASQVAVGAAEIDPSTWVLPAAPAAPADPRGVHAHDVDQVEATTRLLRATDHQWGSGACAHLIDAHLHHTLGLLRRARPGPVTERLYRASADLHNLAGWVSLDLGHYGRARLLWARALEQAQHVGSASLVANLCYRIGRLYLHQHMPDRARSAFQLGQIPAAKISCQVTAALLHANEAWAHATSGQEEHCLRSLGQARDAFDRANGTTPSESWLTFFAETDLEALTGVAYSALPASSPRHTRAIEHLERAMSRRGPDMTRSHVFELTAMGTVHLAAGDREEGHQAAEQALALARQVRSQRVLDRLEPLQRAAAAHTDSHSRDLAEAIAKLRTHE